MPAKTDVRAAFLPKALALTKDAPVISTATHGATNFSNVQVESGGFKHAIAFAKDTLGGHQLTESYRDEAAGIEHHYVFQSLHEGEMTCRYHNSKGVVMDLEIGEEDALLYSDLLREAALAKVKAPPAPRVEPLSPNTDVSASFFPQMMALAKESPVVSTASAGPTNFCTVEGSGGSFKHSMSFARDLRGGHQITDSYVDMVDGVEHTYRFQSLHEGNMTCRYHNSRGEVKDLEIGAEDAQAYSQLLRDITPSKMPPSPQLKQALLEDGRLDTAKILKTHVIDGMEIATVRTQDNARHYAGIHPQGGVYLRKATPGTDPQVQSRTFAHSIRGADQPTPTVNQAQIPTPSSALRDTTQASSLRDLNPKLAKAVSTDARFQDVLAQDTLVGSFKVLMAQKFEGLAVEVATLLVKGIKYYAGLNHEDELYMTQVDPGIDPKIQSRAFANLLKAPPTQQLDGMDDQDLSR